MVHFSIATDLLAALKAAHAQLDSIQWLVTGVGRTTQKSNGMDMLADAVQSILDDGKAAANTAEQKKP